MSEIDEAFYKLTVKQRDDAWKEIDRLKKEITDKNESLRKKNLELDSMHYVWCTGGCLDGTHRWDGGKLTREVLEKARRNVHRMGVWLDARDARERYMEHREVMEKAREKEGS